jgi:hypothetical protein
VKALVVAGVALAVVVAGVAATVALTSPPGVHVVAGSPTPTPTPTSTSTGEPDGAEPQPDATVVATPTAEPTVAPPATPAPRSSAPDRRAAPNPPVSGGSGPHLGAPAPSTGIVLGETTDELGQSHALALNVVAGARDALLQTNSVFAVVSGASRFSVTGAAAVDAWRFTVDATATGSDAPIILIKHTTSSSAQVLAADPNAFAAAVELNEDVVAASARLSALIAAVIAKADPANPTWYLYDALARQLVDPAWTGVLVFNAVATVPVEVQGQGTGALANRQVVALALGFRSNALAGAPGVTETLFGTIDLAQSAGDALPLGVQYLRTGFANSLLASYEQG